MRLVAGFLAVLLFGFQARDEVYINHVYLVLDGATFSAIQQSDFVKREFCGLRTATVRADSNQLWTGLYLFGSDTYIELFDGAPSDRPGDRSDAVAFGVDSAGGLDRLRAHLLSLQWQVELRNRTRLMGDKSIPWFKSIEVPVSGGVPAGFRSWVMEYEVSYMNEVVRRALGRAPGHDVDRRLYNSRVYDSTKLFRNIQEIGLTLTEVHADQFGLLLAACGWEAQPVTEGVYRYQGPGGTTISMRVSAVAPGGISFLKFVLNRGSCPVSPLRFGEASQLVFACEDRTATWYF